MKIRFGIAFLIFIWLFSNGCGQTLSQSAEQNTKSSKKTGKKSDSVQRVYQDYEFVGRRTIKKYGLEIIITSRNDEFNKGFDLSFKKSNTSKCLLYRTSYFDAGLAGKTVEIVSPDEEFITLPCGDETSGFCIWQTSKIAAYFNDKDNFQEGKSGGNYCVDGMDTFKTPLEPSADSIAIFDLKNEENFPHKFGGWKSDKSLAFSVKNPANNNWEEYLYNLTEKKIFGKNSKTFGIAKNSNGELQIVCKP